MVTVYKPNIQVIQQQAAEAREYEKSRKKEGGGDLAWGEIKDGENVLRVLPPTDSRGVIGKKVAKHYFNRTAVGDKIPAHLCLARTFPEELGVVCPTCEIGDKLKSQFPQLNLSGWHSPGVAYYVQAVDRLDPEARAIAKLYRFTPVIRNWFVTELESAMQKGIDLTDFQAGIDIKIVKTVSTYMKNGRQRSTTKYDKTLWSLQGPTPLDPDPNVVQAIVASMKDPDQIWKYPDDAKLAEYHKYAADIMSFYMKKQYETPGVMVNIPGAVSGQVVTPQQVGMHQPQQVPQMAQQVQPQTQTMQQPQVMQPQVQAAAQPTQMTIPQTAQVEQPQVAQQVMQQSAPMQVEQTGPVGAPSDKPPCFGGAAPRSTNAKFSSIPEEMDGTGYSDESEMCLTCPSELECMTASGQ